MLGHGMPPLMRNHIGTTGQRAPPGRPTPDHDLIAVPIGVVIALGGVIDTGEHGRTGIIETVASEMMQQVVVHETGINLPVNSRRLS